MNSESWMKTGFVRFTAERTAGTLSGIGLGILLGHFWSTLFPTGPANGLAQVIAFFSIFAGTAWAASIQQKRLQKDKAEKEIDS
jgi:hypothetical protein